MRIFQLAKEFKVESQEILDALDDMGVVVKSNLASVEDSLVAELRELFRPKPKSAVDAREEAVRRALAEREARERAAEEAAQREAERKEQARRAALKKAGALRAEVKQAEVEQARVIEETRRSEATLAAPAAAEAEGEAGRVVDEATKVASAQQEPADLASEETATDEAPLEEKGAEEATKEETPAPEKKGGKRVSRPAAAAQDAPAGSLGKAVIAPPPTTAKERAELLGKPLSALPSSRARRPVATPTRSTTGAPPAGHALPDRGRAARQPGGAGRGRPGAGRGRGRASTGRRSTVKRQQAAENAAAREAQAAMDAPIAEVRISDGITIKELAERMKRKANDVIKLIFMEKKIMATINHALDEETARWVVENFGGTAVSVGLEEEAAAVEDTTLAGLTGEREETPEERLVTRPPIVTMMGHVDHGKTSLLDAIRATRVAEREAGGITQHIGAYTVTKEHDGVERQITFLDTPGHAAFTLMRARGAKATDVIVLVVAADDGVMPQTVEAINHAKAAGVPLIVAVNKIDKSNALPDRVLQQLVEHEILCEEFGGDTVTVKVSAKTGEGLDNLLEMILLVTEVQELQAAPDRPASGVILEAKLDKARGPIATILVQDGTLEKGNVFVAGSGMGRVRAMLDEDGKRVDQAGPSTPVAVMGLDEVPQAGELFQVFSDEQKARQIAIYLKNKKREEEASRRSALPTLDKLHERIQRGEINELPIVVKADVQGSVEVLNAALEKLSTDEVLVKVIHSGTGAITENDVLLASASQAIIIGFNVRPDRSAVDSAEREGVEIRLHTVIYKVADEIKLAMIETLSPVEKEVFLGTAEVRQTFKVPKIGVIAGSYVKEGKIRRDAQVRLLRDHVVIHEGRLTSLRRFKDDAKEVRAGFECGIGLENYQDLKPGDIVEAFVIEAVKRESLEKTD